MLAASMGPWRATFSNDEELPLGDRVSMPWRRSSGGVVGIIIVRLRVYYCPDKVVIAIQSDSSSCVPSPGGHVPRFCRGLLPPGVPTTDQ
jgi:hypothetical protein